MAPTRKTEADWLPYKSYITNLVRDEQCNNADVLERLQSQGFHASKSQLEYQLKNWNLRRKLPKGQSADIWRCVGHRVAKRRTEGKESKVVIDGKVYDAREVKKEIGRNQPSTLSRIQQGSASPSSPEGMVISVRSPSPFDLQSSWPSNLPWFKFKLRLTIPVSPTTTFLTQCTNDLLRLLTRHSITEDGQDIVQYNDCDSLPVMSRLASGLHRFMPEECPDAFLTRARSIIHGSGSQRLEQLLMVVVFRLSNNIDVNKFTKIWPTVLNLFQISGIMSKPLERKDTTDITGMAVAEKLYRIAFWAGFHSGLRQPEEVKEGTRTLIKWLLSSGHDPNAMVSIGTDGLGTGLYAAVLFQEVDLALMLLQRGANPNLKTRMNSKVKLYTTEGKLPLLIAVDSNDYPQRFSLVKALLDNGADPNLYSTDSKPYPLYAAICHFDLPIIELLIQYEAEISQWTAYEYEYDIPRHCPEIPISAFTSIRSVMGYAAGISPESNALSITSYLLAQLRKRNKTTNVTRFIPVESLLIAAARGYNSVLALILEQGIDVDASNSRFYTALHLAAFWGHLDTCDMLINQYGASVESNSSRQGIASPLHLAAYGDHLDVVKLLHRSGASINPKIQWNDNRVSDTTPFRVNNRCFPSSHDLFPSSYDLFPFSYDMFPLSYNMFQPTHMDIMDPLRQFCSTPIIAAMHNAKTGSTYQYLASKGAFIPDWMAHYAAGKLKDVELLSFLLKKGKYFDENATAYVTLLEAALFPKDITGEAEDEATDEASNFSSREIARILLSRGFETSERHAVLALMRGDWDLAVRILLRFDYYAGHLYGYITRSGEAMTWTMIHAACFGRNVVAIHRVLDLDLDTYDEKALCLAVLLACETEDDEAVRVVERLIERRMRKDFRCHEIDEQIETLAVGIASWYDEIELLKLLLRVLSPSQIVEIKQPIYFLNIDFNPAIACSFIPIGVEEDTYREHYFPLLKFATSPEARTLLLRDRWKADIKVLHEAVESGDSAFVKELLFINQGPFGHGLLSKAVEVGSIDMVEILLEANEDINDKSNENKPRYGNPLQTAIGEGHMGIWDLLLSKSPDVNAAAARYYKGTALQIACGKGYLSLAKQLICLGASINVKKTKYQNQSALECAAENGRIDMIQLLLSSGAITTGEWRKDYIRAVTIAQENGHQAAAQVLRQHRKWEAEDKRIFTEIKYPHSSRVVHVSEI
ncbi:ankyrin repeat-containing domain protein [Daldinia caldariorum]|uniref:ankyrin repeat-containing domain protein n=1 Tax=Daldinia caldariorum TaxID=326644 RepID=UPI0020073F67|nr:ankyrin repeat-containing domain protein [Daldinia caldariorum]KAI1464463.1 ankyrin repeat-containing domain protein [Daldinia caldariorum]